MKRLDLLIEKFYSPLVKINPKPIIVLGNQKSGTTAIAALLAEYSAKSVTLDIRGLYEPVQTRIHHGELIFEDFVQTNRIDFSRAIIKEPALTFLYKELINIFPEGQYVFVIRDPRENIRSILNRLKIDGRQGEIDYRTYPTITAEWQLILDGRWMGLHGDTYIELMAARWNRAVDIYLQDKENFQLVRFEDFIDDKVGTITRLAHELCIQQINRIEDKVEIQFQPKGNREVSWKDFFGTENLSFIETICAKRMQYFGYQVSDFSIRSRK